MAACCHNDAGIDSQEPCGFGAQFSDFRAGGDRLTEFVPVDPGGLKHFLRPAPVLQIHQKQTAAKAFAGESPETQPHQDEIFA